ncbi:MAG: tetratricopeptide repeat protein [Gammaproteobacteria bacterium]|nr:tetratricopeptide repeat protein [Gammaproteobacteria bacterium]
MNSKVLIALVVLLGGAGGLAWWLWPAPDSIPAAGAPAPAAADTSVAVLPFRDESGGKDYLGHGMSEELRNALARVQGLTVAARTSSVASSREPTHDIGVSLNVSSVVEGSVKLDGNTLRVTARLLNARNGQPMWERSFEAELDRMFELQQDISGAIAQALGLDPAAPGGAPTASVAAYDLYLAGRYHWHQRTPESLQRAIDLFEQAVALDDRYALAYTGLADAHLLLRGYGNLSATEAQARAEPAIRKALALDDTLAEAHASLGLFYLGNRKLDESAAAFDRAIELNPNYSMAHMWRGLIHSEHGDLRRAHAAFQAAHRLDPLHPTININLASTTAKLGDLDQGLAYLHRVIAADPGAGGAYRALAQLNRGYGRFDAAWRWASKAVAVESESPTSVLTLAMSCLSLGDFEAARAHLDRARELAPQNPDVLDVAGDYGMLSGDRSLLDALVARGLAEQPGWEGKPEKLRLWSAFSQVLDGRPEAALAQLDRLVDPDSPEDTDLSTHLQLEVLPVMAMLFKQLGQPERAAALVRRASALVATEREKGYHHHGLDYVSGVLSLLQDDHETALAHLRAARADGFRDYHLLRNDPRWAALRDDAGFQAELETLRVEVEAMRARVEAETA